MRNIVYKPQIQYDAMHDEVDVSIRVWINSPQCSPQLVTIRWTSIRKQSDESWWPHRQPSSTSDTGIVFNELMGVYAGRTSIRSAITKLVTMGHDPVVITCHSTAGLFSIRSVFERERLLGLITSNLGVLLTDKITIW